MGRAPRGSARVRYSPAEGWIVQHTSALTHDACLLCLRSALVTNEQRARGLPPGDKTDTFARGLRELREVIAGDREFKMVVVPDGAGQATAFAADADYAPKLYVGGPLG